MQLPSMPPTIEHDFNSITDALCDRADGFTCTEAEAIVRLLRAFGLEVAAQNFADAHADGDDDEDDRHRPGHPEDWEHIYDHA